MAKTNNIHDDIREALKRDEPVYSNVLGRVGRVMSVSDNKKDLFPVEICTFSRKHLPEPSHDKHQHAATTFLKGDEVELVPDVEHWRVVNTFRPTK